MTPDQAAAGDDYCYLTTTGRVSGQPREIEIWFVLEGRSVYLLAGDHRSHWVQNAEREPAVSVRIRDVTYPATARVLQAGPEDAMVRERMGEKYAPRHEGDLTDWLERGLVVALDVV